MTTGDKITFSISSMVSQTRHPIALFRWLRRAGTTVLQQAFEVVEHEGSVTMRSYREWIDVPLVEDDADRTITHHEPGEFGEGARVIVAADCPVCGGTRRLGPYFPGGLSTTCGNCTAISTKGSDHDQ